MSQARITRMKRQQKRMLTEKQGKKRLCEDCPPHPVTPETSAMEVDDPCMLTPNDTDYTHPSDYMRKLSLEILCKILSYLPLKDVVRLARLSRRMNEAISMHLRLLRDIDFTEGEIYGWMCPGFTDTTFASFLKRCPEVINIYGLHMIAISKRRHRGSEHLSIPGIIAALSSCKHLYGVETSDVFLLEAITNYLPWVHILSRFKNRNGSFPILQKNRFDLHRNPRITSLNLVGVVISELPRMDFLKQLHLRWVKLTDSHPFKDFGVPLLQSFVMNNCAGPANALKYVPLITGLAGARSLKRMELVRVPFLGGLVQHVVEDSWRMQGFRQLCKVVFGSCKHALEVDLGYLVITCATRLEELSVQPSLTKDSFFTSLTLADVNFPQFEALHLGYIDDFPEHGTLTNEQLVRHGLADVNESPAMITDIGMKAVGQVFSNVKTLTVYNCPHLLYPTTWSTHGQSWQRLKELHLRRCHALKLEDFCWMIPHLTSLESLCLEQMFREPPKGCSRVGLSAGTGLGVSSALVQNSTNDIPNQGQGNNPPVVPANLPANAAAAGHPPPPPANLMDSDSDREMDNSDLMNDDWCNGEGERGGVGAVTEGDNPRDEPQCCCDKTRSDDNQSLNLGLGAEECTCSGDTHKYDAKDVQRIDVSEQCSDICVDTSNMDVSPMRRSRRLSRPRDGSAVPSTSQHRFPGYKGKGKSLRGRKKGLMKRSRSREAHVTNRSQSCQAVSEEIRETTKKAKDGDVRGNKEGSGRKRGEEAAKKCPVHFKVPPNPPPPVQKAKREDLEVDGEGEMVVGDGGGEDRMICSRSTQTGGGGGGEECGGGEREGEAYILQKPNMCDQSTSTSDPVIEEDHIQVLKIRSTTLVHLTIRQVGVTNLSITDCPKLQLLVGNACRVLKVVSIENAAQISRVNFSQCTKLDQEALIEQVCKEPPEYNRLILLRPMQQYNPLSLRECLFKSSNYDYHMCLIHDYSVNPELTLHNRLRASTLLDVMAILHYELLTSGQLLRASRKPDETKYPWGRDIYTMRGMNVDDSWWEMTTDLPWLRALSSHTANMPSPDHDQKAGICSLHNFSTPESALEVLETDIAEAKERGCQIYNHSTLVYVNTCDLYGAPVKDMYI